MGITGWIVLLYNLLMTVCVFATVLVEMIFNMMAAVSGGVFDMDQIMASAMTAVTSAWGYFVTGIVGIIILLCWKKPRYWKEEIWAKGKAMKPADFCGILLIFLSVQFIYLLYASGLESLFNVMGYSLLEGMESVSGGADTLSMFLYMGVLAPVTEEILFRGLIQRTLLPYGKKLAILGSAFLFGMMHGNILQTPFAFLVGLVLGYTAAEYSIWWAIALHMLNNMVMADLLPRLLGLLPGMAGDMILGGILWVFAIAAVVILIVKRQEVKAYIRGECMDPRCVRGFFLNSGFVAMTVLMIVSMLMMVTPV